MTEQLVHAARRGDPAAFASLIAPTRGRLIAVVARIVGADEAEDIVQEALLRAFLGLSRLREPALFESWLCGVAINVAKMRVRERVTQARAVAASLRGPASLEQEPELLDIVREALEVLPAGQRDVVMMHYVDDLSCDAIASLLGTSAGAVRVRLHRARAHLRRELAPLAPVPLTTEEKEKSVVDMKVEDVVVRVAAGDPSHVVQEVRAIILLKERSGTRSMPIFVGMPEAATLAVPLANRAFPRPSTADLAIELVRAAGASIDRIAITRMNDNVVYAVVSINGEDVDARPSDAINLAVRVGAPILVDERVLDAHAVAGTSVAEQIEAAATRLGHGIPAGLWKSLSLELLRALLPPEAKLSPP